MALTRTTQQEETQNIDLNLAETFKAVNEAFTKVGKIQSVQEKFGRITGSIYSGFLNMNKADVTINVKLIEENKTEIKIIASSQEGLVLQNTCAKAISRILESI